MKPGNFDILSQVGETPMLGLRKIERELGLYGKIFAKAEFLNPGGSVKDRVANFCVLVAQNEGKLTQNSRIVEATSGNMGISLALVGICLGYRVELFMPENMSGERVALMRSLGARLTLTPQKEGMAGAIARAEEASLSPDCFYVRQFENPASVLAHRRTTGPEIYSALSGRVDVFVAGVGSGGSLSGVGEYLKEKNPEVKIVAVEPKESAVLSGFAPDVHGISGIGAGFVPKILNRNIIDEVISVSSRDAFDFARLLLKKEGLIVGISSGAAVLGARILAGREENKGKNIVTILPDRAERYFSTGLL